MPSTQFIHVVQFFETIFCFSLLVLIGQKFLTIFKSLNQKYLQDRLTQSEDESKWYERRQQHDLEFNRDQDVPQLREQDKNKKQSQQQKVQAPKQQTLKTSLVENQNDQTDRKIAQAEAQEIKQFKRKSLTDLSKQQQRNSKQIEIKDETESTPSRKQSIDSDKGGQNVKHIQVDEKKKKKSEGFERPQFVDQQPSIASNYSNPEGEHRAEIKKNFNVQLLTQIDAIFNQHIPLLMSILILGIIVNSTYIFTIVCFFGYLFTHLILKAAGGRSNKTNLSNNQSLLSKLGIIFPKLWIVAIFISYWSDSQFS